MSLRSYRIITFDVVETLIASLNRCTAYKLAALVHDRYLVQWHGRSPPKSAHQSVNHVSEHL
jgi:hypothetical protein